MNPLNTTLRRNRFSGFSARPGTNALSTSSWGKKNPNGIPIQKLGLIWNSLLTGIKLVEAISNELEDEDVFDLAENARSLPKPVSDLVEMYESAISGRYREWASRTTRSRIIEMARSIESPKLSSWLSRVTLREGSSAVREWFLFEGGKLVEDVLRKTLNHGDQH